MTNSCQVLVKQAYHYVSKCLLICPNIGVTNASLDPAYPERNCQK